jgi:hypothetical protein
VRGSPSDVLDVLMHGSINTTILGPARTVEVLQCTKDDKTTKEVRGLEKEVILLNKTEQHEQNKTVFCGLTKVMTWLVMSTLMPD